MTTRRPVSVVHAARVFRARLIAQDDQALAEIGDHYRAIIGVINQRLRAVTGQLALLPPGEPVPISWLYERDRLTQFRGQVERELRARLPGLTRVAVGHQEAASTLAHTDALTLINRAANTQLAHQRLDTARAAQAAGQARAEVVKDLFRELPMHAGRVASRALETGITLGQSPDVIAQNMTRALGGNRARAQTIARTEALRAYRESSMETWRRDGDVSRWQWFSTLDRTACPVCWAMHGTLHPITETMGSHPSCRCTPLPVVNGTPPPIPETESGVARFERLTYMEQRDLIGPRKHDAYLDGRLRLPDLVATENDPRWGLVRRERGVGAAMGNAPPGGHQPPPPPPPATGAFNRQRLAPRHRAAVDEAETLLAQRGITPQTSTRIVTANIGRDTGRFTRPRPDASNPIDPYISLSATSRPTDNMASVALHELGHAIDQHADVRMASEVTESAHWARFLVAARDSPTGQKVRAGATDDYGRYLARQREMWARAFQQYMAETDPPTFRALMDDQGMRSSFWKSPEWPIIRDAVEGVLRAEGWL